MTMVLITGGIDLSVAAIASLTGMFIAYGNSILGIDPFLCIAFAMVIGISLGALMGRHDPHTSTCPPSLPRLRACFWRAVCAP